VPQTPLRAHPYPGLPDPANVPADLQELAVSVEDKQLAVISRQVFTASGTWTKPSGAKYVQMEVVGGGGGGAGAQATATGECAGGGGGGAGGYASRLMAASALSATETVTVGAGGTVVVAASGNSGGTSSVGTQVSATGGGGGVITAGPVPRFAVASGGTGGIGTDGDLNARGGAGLPFTGDQFRGTGGTGGDSLFGGGGIGPWVGVVTSQPGMLGGGGAGAVNTQNSAAVAGRVGGAGIVIITTYG